MTQDDEIWSIERGFWLKGDDHMRTHTGETCIMIFPSPVGILRDGNVFEGLKSAPRWDEVEISDQVCQRLEPDAVLIAYKARGERGGDCLPSCSHPSLARDGHASRLMAIESLHYRLSGSE